MSTDKEPQASEPTPTQQQAPKQQKRGRPDEAEEASEADPKEPPSSPPPHTTNSSATEQKPPTPATTDTAVKAQDAPPSSRTQAAQTDAEAGTQDDEGPSKRQKKEETPTTAKAATAAAASSMGVTKMTVPNSHVGLIIGKGGEKIRELQVLSGALINLLRDSETTPNSSEREVTITGTEEAREKARALLTQIALTDVNKRSAGVQAATPTPLAPVMPHVMPPMQMPMPVLPPPVVTPPALAAAPPAVDPTKPYLTAQPGEVKREIYIPTDKIGLLIGKQGATINQMKAETGANIQIQRNVPNPMPNMTTIFIFAKSYPQCDSAIKLIEGRIGPVVHPGGAPPPAAPAPVTVTPAFQAMAAPPFAFLPPAAMMPQAPAYAAPAAPAYPPPAALYGGYYAASATPSYPTQQQPSMLPPQMPDPNYQAWQNYYAQFYQPPKQ